MLRVDEKWERIPLTIADWDRKEGSVTVQDWGRGIPVDIHKQTGKSALETVMTKLHAGGKFGSGAYKVSGGLHGVGVSAVNGLSEWLEVEVSVDGQVYGQRYHRGVPQADVVVIGKYASSGSLITAEQLQTKCPSKYKGQASPAAQTTGQ